VLYFQVQFLSSGQEIPDAIVFRKLLAVRRDKVLAALRWLCQNNRVYQTHCDISNANADCYAQNDVPRAVYRNISVVNQRPVRDQQSSYAQPDDCADDETVVESNADGDVDCPLEMRGLADTNARAVLDEDIERKATQNSGLNSVLYVPAGRPVSDYNNANLYYGTFADLYPYASGGPDDPRRPTKLSLAAYAQHWMYAADDALRTDRLYPYFLFNVLQRHRAQSSAFTSLRLHRFDRFSNILDSLHPDKLKIAVQELHQAQKSGQFGRLNDISDTALRSEVMRIFREIRAIGGRLPLNESAKLVARKEILALTLRYGPADFFMTVNPNDENSALLLHFAGETIALDLEDPDKPLDAPSAAQRRAILGRDPFAAALFSHTLMRAVNFALLGVDHQEGEEVGLFGKVEAVHWNSEEQNRGSLHWHGLIWLSNKPDPRVFSAWLSSPEFQARLFAYLDSVVMQQPPALSTRGMLRNPQANSVDPEEYHCPLKKVYLDDHPSLQRPTNPAAFASDEQWCEHVAATLDQLIPLVQTHSRLHTHTCKKPAMLRAKLIDEKEAEKQALALAKDPNNVQECPTCRFHFPRTLHEATHIDKDGDVMIERRHHWTNSFSPLLTYCLRCNVDVRTLWGNSGDALAAMFYITNYVSKV